MNQKPHLRVRVAVMLASTAVAGLGAGAPAAFAADQGQGAAHRSQHKLTASLSGAAEIPGPGDSDGTGKARIQFKKNSICFKLSWRNIAAPTAAHIHEGSATEAGPVVVTLFSAPEGLRAPKGHARGCVAVAPALIEEIRSDPSDYYVNVHNAPFPGGAIRGQLHR